MIDWKDRVFMAVFFLVCIFGIGSCVFGMVEYERTQDLMEAAWMEECIPRYLEYYPETLDSSVEVICRGAFERSLNTWKNPDPHSYMPWGNE